MAAAATTLTSCRFARDLSVPPRAAGDCFLHFRPLPLRPSFGRASARQPWLRRPTAVCFVLKEVGKEQKKNEAYTWTDNAGEGEEEGEMEGTEEIRISWNRRTEERAARKQKERRRYLIAAVMSSLGFTSMAVAAVYYRFSWQMEGGEIPLTEMFGTFALSVGAAVSLILSALLLLFLAGVTRMNHINNKVVYAGLLYDIFIEQRDSISSRGLQVGMEFWARWAHRALWHASLWHMHESHHRPRDGPFELNDVFAIINAVPAISLMAYGFLNRGLLPGLCFGAGLGITLFGMAYMFVHDGLVHRRFPVGPIANVPYFRRVAAAHQIHHMDKFEGVPYGLFLGPKVMPTNTDLGPRCRFQ
ncbi:Fatty acid hydroxylase superfamily [Musa troglodytarum]|uniref:beta-carotene 3-hydroxylase n=1 Tax=Musa troglodytarum TaxID=320322 RepID=A0A9E7L6M6_9LILI|nr:Fatty acid hydroxylase superfamily [Musa troglodytarum]